MKRATVSLIAAVLLAGCAHAAPKPAHTGWPKADRDAFLSDRATAGATIKVAECQLANAERMFPDWAHAQFATLKQLMDENAGCV
jgi:hypothetical protein